MPDKYSRCILSADAFRKGHDGLAVNTAKNPTRTGN